MIDAKNNVSTTLSIADSKFHAFDMAGCLEYVEKTSDLLMELESNTRLAKRLESGYFDT